MRLTPKPGSALAALMHRTTGYQTQAFVGGSWRSWGWRWFSPPTGAMFWRTRGRTALSRCGFEDPEAPGRRRSVQEYARTNPVAALVPIGDRADALCSTSLGRALGLLSHPPGSRRRLSRQVPRSRERLRQAGAQRAWFLSLSCGCRTPGACWLQTRLGGVGLPSPWVLKPLALSASRGVIRADTAEEICPRSFERIRAHLLRTPTKWACCGRETSHFAYRWNPTSRGRRSLWKASWTTGGCAFSGFIFDKPDPLGRPLLRGDHLRHALASGR